MERVFLASESLEVLLKTKGIRLHHEMGMSNTEYEHLITKNRLLELGDVVYGSADVYNKLLGPGGKAKSRFDKPMGFLVKCGVNEYTLYSKLNKIVLFSLADGKYYETVNGARKEIDKNLYCITLIDNKADYEPVVYHILGNDTIPLNGLTVESVEQLTIHVDVIRSDVQIESLLTDCKVCNEIFVSACTDVPSVGSFKCVGPLLKNCAGLKKIRLHCDEIINYSLASNCSDLTEIMLVEAVDLGSFKRLHLEEIDNLKEINFYGIIKPTYYKRIRKYLDLCGKQYVDIKENIS